MDKIAENLGETALGTTGVVVGLVLISGIG